MSSASISVSVDLTALHAAVAHSASLHNKLRAIAEDIVTEAQSLAPVLTGALRDSITAEDLGGGEFDVVAGVDYASYVEFGTMYAQAQPFLRPAIDAVTRGL